MFWYKVLRNQ